MPLTQTELILVDFQYNGSSGEILKIFVAIYTAMKVVIFLRHSTAHVRYTGPDYAKT